MISRVLAGFAATVFVCAMAGCLVEDSEPEPITGPNLEPQGEICPDGTVCNYQRCCAKGDTWGCCPFTKDAGIAEPVPLPDPDAP